MARRKRPEYMQYRNRINRRRLSNWPRYTTAFELRHANGELDLRTKPFAKCRAQGRAATQVPHARLAKCQQLAINIPWHVGIVGYRGLLLFFSGPLNPLICELDSHLPRIVFRGRERQGIRCGHVANPGSLAQELNNLIPAQCEGSVRSSHERRRLILKSTQRLYSDQLNAYTGFLSFRHAFTQVIVTAQEIGVGTCSIVSKDDKVTHNAGIHTLLTTSCEPAKSKLYPFQGRDSQLGWRGARIRGSVVPINPERAESGVLAADFPNLRYGFVKIHLQFTSPFCSMAQLATSGEQIRGVDKKDVSIQSWSSPLMKKARLNGSRAGWTAEPPDRR